MNKLITSILILILFACATVQSPVGGEKDTKPPELYESTPKDQSIGFEGKKIRLYFNEWMEADNLNKQLIITPRTDIKYEHTLKKQELIIDLEKTLQDSTTYTFNFRKGLKDITEGNLWQDPVLAFSTGSYMDSLKVSGTVIDLKTNQAVKEFTVGLYDAKYDTANLRQGEPVYFTTTDEEGYYLLQNLRPGQYKLYAFNDKNDNLTNQSASEPYAFYSKEIDLKDSIAPILLNSYKNNEDTLKLTKTGPIGKDFLITFNKGIQNFSIINSNDSSQFIYVNNEENSQKLRVYKENFPELEFEYDSIALYVNVIDSIGMSLKDTVYAKYRESRIKSEELKITQMPEKNIKSGEQQLIINFNNPIKNINTDSIFVNYDSILVYSITSDKIEYGKNRKSVKININLNIDSIDSIKHQQKELADSLSSLNSKTTNPIDSSDTLNTDSTVNIDKKDKTALKGPKMTSDKQGSHQSQTKTINGLHLYLGKGAFIGIENDSTQSNNVVFEFMKSENYGIVKGSVQNSSNNFIVELVNNKYEKVDSISNSENFTFNYVKPGEYYLRAIIDRNNNGRWDPGNPLLLIPEEDIIYLNEKITVKANWEVIDKIIDLGEENSVDNSEENNDL